VGPPPRPQPLLNTDEAISEVMQELDEMRLTQQEINEERKRLWRKRPTKEAEKEQVARRLEQLHQKSKCLHEEALFNGLSNLRCLESVKG